MYKGIAITALFAGAAVGQTTAPAGSGPITMAMMNGGGDPAPHVQIMTSLIGKPDTVAGAPYSAQTSTERVQTLADGNRIVQTATGSVARDKQGRTRREEGIPGLTATNNQAPPKIVMIDDPVAQVHWTLDANSKTASKLSLSGLPAKQAAEARALAMNAPLPPPPPAPNAGSGRTASIVIIDRAGGTPDAFSLSASNKAAAESDMKKTDLGMQTIEGVPAQGTRLTNTIPAGQMGNDMPITITTETWYSPDLKVIVMSKSSDPRIGETTYKLTGIQRGEPAASLFQVPDDYTVKDSLAPFVTEDHAPVK